MRIALLCPGLGRAFRGYERFAAELFDAARDRADITLFSGEGKSSEREHPLGGLGRSGLPARVLGRLSHDVYYWEAVSFARLAWKRVNEFDLLHYSEPPLNLAFTRLEKRLSRRPRRLFSHALNMGAEHTLRCHHIHQTSPDAVDAARNLGVPDDRMTLLPYGIWTERFRSDRSDEKRRRTRAEYGMPQAVPVVMCVAAVNRTHKRVDHLVREVARLEKPVHLLLCGALDDPSLLEEARKAPGDSDVTHLYVSNAKMLDLYAAADVFVLPSLVEGFGLGVVEAQLSGLPVIAHASPHFRWLLGAGATNLVDMTAPGALAAMIDEVMSNLSAVTASAAEARNAQAERYDWERLLPSYLDMYASAASHSPDLIESLVER